MKRMMFMATAAALALAASVPALDQAEARPRWERGGVSNGPPPWAPAWGYRARQRGVHPGRSMRSERLVRQDNYEWRGERGGRGRGNGRGR